MLLRVKGYITRFSVCGDAHMTHLLALFLSLFASSSLLLLPLKKLISE